MKLGCRANVDNVLRLHKKRSRQLPHSQLHRKRIGAGKHCFDDLAELTCSWSREIFIARMSRTSRTELYGEAIGIRLRGTTWTGTVRGRDGETTRCFRWSSRYGETGLAAGFRCLWPDWQCGHTHLPHGSLITPCRADCFWSSGCFRDSPGIFISVRAPEGFCRLIG